MPCTGQIRRALPWPLRCWPFPALKEPEIRALWKSGRASMPVYEGPEADKKNLLDYILTAIARDRCAADAPAAPQLSDAGYRNSSITTITRHETPVGELIAIDLNSGQNRLAHSARRIRRTHPQRCPHYRHRKLRRPAGHRRRPRLLRRHVATSSSAPSIKPPEQNSGAPSLSTAASLAATYSSEWKTIHCPPRHREW